LQRKEAKKSGLIEGISTFRNRRKVNRLLLHAMQNTGVAGDESLKRAASLFSELDPKAQEKQLSETLQHLERASDWTFESDEKAHSMRVLADFIRSSADLVKDTRLKEEIIFVLKEVLNDTNLFNERNMAHLEVNLACTRALWDLGFRDMEYWSDKLMRPELYDTLAGHLLEMPETENFEEHGWSVLRNELKSISVVLALEGPEKKYDFFASMLLDTKPSVLEAALEGVLYLPALPDELGMLVDDVSGISDSLGEMVEQFRQARKCMGLLKGTDEEKIQASNRLISLYEDGMMHLRPLLEGICIEMGELFLNPSGDSPEAMAEIQEDAFSVLSKLRNYTQNGFQALAEIAGYMVNVMVDPKGDSDEEKDAQRHSAEIVLRKLKNIGIAVEGINYQ
jgi:hypothetical protein